MTSLLKQLNRLTVENILQLNTACFMYRVATKTVPAELAQLFTTVREGSQRFTRQSNNFLVPPYKLKSAPRSLMHRGSKL